MGRITTATKQSYTPCDQIQGTCAYCFKAGEPLKPDYTPPTKFVGDFPAERIVAQVCIQCWGKVYYANVVLKGSPWTSLETGMTFEQKLQLIQGNPSGDNGIIARSGEYLYPREVLMGDDGLRMFRGIRVTEEAWRDLQGAFALRLSGADREVIVHNITMVTMASPHLEPDLFDLYCEMAGV